MFGIHEIKGASDLPGVRMRNGNGSWSLSTPRSLQTQTAAVHVAKPRHFGTDGRAVNEKQVSDVAILSPFWLFIPSQSVVLRDLFEPISGAEPVDSLHGGHRTGRPGAQRLRISSMEKGVTPWVGWSGAEVDAFWTAWVLQAKSVRPILGSAANSIFVFAKSFKTKEGYPKLKIFFWIQNCFENQTNSLARNTFVQFTQLSLLLSQLSRPTSPLISEHYFKTALTPPGKSPAWTRNGEFAFSYDTSFLYIRIWQPCCIWDDISPSSLWIQRGPANVTWPCSWPAMSTCVAGFDETRDDGLSRLAARETPAQLARAFLDEIYKHSQATCGYDKIELGLSNSRLIQNVEIPE